MSLTHLCQILDVSRSGFYAWQRRPASTHARRDQQLRVLIRASHEASRGTYGSPRLHRDLQAQGHRVSRKRVIRLKQAEGLTARVRKRFKRTTMSDHDQPVATNVLGQDFGAEAPNQRWVGDTTEFVIGSSGKLSLAALLDPLLALGGRLGRQCHQRSPSGHQGPPDGSETPRAPSGAAASLRPRQPVCERGLPTDHQRTSHDRQHESSR